MKRIEGRIGGHEPMLDVRFDDLCRRRRNLEQRKLLGQRKSGLSARILAIPQLKEHRVAGHQCVALACSCPPAPGPGAASQRFSA